MKIAFSQKYKCSYLAVPNNVILNQPDNKTYEMQYANSNNNSLYYNNALYY